MTTVWFMQDVADDDVVAHALAQVKALALDKLIDQEVASAAAVGLLLRAQVRLRRARLRSEPASCLQKMLGKSQPVKVL